MLSVEWGGGGKSGGNGEGQVENTLAGVDSEPCGSQGLKLPLCPKMVLVNRRAWRHISESSRAKSSPVDPESSLLLGYCCIQSISASDPFGMISPSTPRLRTLQGAGKHGVPGLSGPRQQLCSTQSKKNRQDGVRTKQCPERSGSQRLSSHSAGVEGNLPQAYAFNSPWSCAFFQALALPSITAQPFLRI